MCTAKAPKTTPVKEKDPQYLRNPYLDNLSMTRSSTYGRNSLRIDGSLPAPSASTQLPPSSTPNPTGYVPPTPNAPPPTLLNRLATKTGGGGMGAMWQRMGQASVDQWNEAETRRLDY